MNNSVFCPGKILLSGEHSVVYGKPALAASIDLGVRVSVETHCNASVRNNIHTDDKGLVRKAIELAGGDPDKVTVTIDSDLPVGSGLGSSAAIAAAVIKAVRLYREMPLSNDELFQLTLEIEKIAHGNPSGVDPATVIYGGLIWYIKGKPVERFAMKHPITVLLINSGKPAESTKEMIEMVATKDKNLIEEIGEITIKMKYALETGGDIIPLITANGLLLEKLGIVESKAQALSLALRNLGAGVKVIGAGGIHDGSGMMLVYHSDLSLITPFLKEKKIHYYEVSLG
jgi:mevalonate kinase